MLPSDRFGAPLHLNILAGDIFALPFAEGTFDAVFNSGVVEHYDKATRFHLLAELRRVTKQQGFVVLVFPNKKHVLRLWWDWLIATFSDFSRYDLPEQDLSASLVQEVSELELDVQLLDWIDCYDTLSHFPNWLPLRLIAFAATVLFPRPPGVLRKHFGTRTMLVARKR